MYTNMIPLRRFASKGELADLALFLCSDAAQYINGAVVVCDGGQSLGARSNWLRNYGNCSEAQITQRLRRWHRNYGKLLRV